MTDEQEAFSEEQQRQLKELFRMSDLAVRYKEGVLTDAEDLELRQWVDASPEHLAWFESALAEETISFRMDTFSESASGSQIAFQDLLEKIVAQRRRVRRRSVVILCSALIVCGLGGYLYVHKVGRDQKQLVTFASPKDISPGSNKATLTLSNGQTVVLDSAHTGVIAEQPGQTTVRNTGAQVSYVVGKGATQGVPLFNTVSTGRGGQYKLVLSDGSKVWLDASSSLIFPTAFRGSQREVILDGQGYFEVAHHREPFIVHTRQKIDIEDLGTSFNINAYANEGSVETTLLNGSIKVTSRNNIRLLIPGQQARITGNEQMVVDEVGDPAETIAWKDGKFAFRHTELREAMKSIARWYNVDIEYMGVVPDKKIDGSSSRNENLSVLIHMLNVIGVNCKIDESKIIIVP